MITTALVAAQWLMTITASHIENLETGLVGYSSSYTKLVEADDWQVCHIIARLEMIEKSAAADYSMKELADMVQGRLIEGEVVSEIGELVASHPSQATLTKVGEGLGKTAAPNLPEQPSKPHGTGDTDPEHDQTVGQDKTKDV